MTTIKLDIGKVFLLDPRHEDFVRDGTQPLKDNTPTWLKRFVIGALVLLSIYLVASEIVFNQVGETAQAEIIDRRSDETTLATTYYVSVIFTTSNNREYELEREVVLHDYEQFLIGETVNVRYLEDEPWNAEIVDTVTVGNRREIIVLLVALILALCYVVYFWVIRPAQINYRLESQGQLLIGSIQNSYPLKTTAGYKVNVEFSFKPPEEDSMSKRASNIRRDMVDTSLPLPGTTILVLYVNKRLWRLM